MDYLVNNVNQWLDHYQRIFTANGTYSHALFDHDRKIIFIISPKAACTTVKNIFFNHMGVKLPSDGFLVHSYEFNNAARQYFKVLPGIDFDKDYVKFHFYRDPYQRAACMFSWNQHYKNGHPRFKKPDTIGGESWEIKDCEFQCDSFHQFLNKIMKGKQINCPQCNVHTIKQFVTPRVDEKINIDNLDDELNRLNKKYNLNLKNITVDNHSLRKAGYKYEDYLDEKAIELIQKAYADDVNFFS